MVRALVADQRRGRRARVAASASLTAAALFIWSPGAWASAGCTTSTPSLGQLITCNSVGTQAITIPTGANAVEVIAIGGGGAGGAGVDTGGNAKPGGNGGAGARVAGTFTVTNGGTLTAEVGAGGSGSAGGGAGGEFSRVQAGGTDLVIAGGGGGGASGNAVGAGGAGGDANGIGGDGGNGVPLPGEAPAEGGSGGSNGTGGAGGTGVAGLSGRNGNPGRNYSDGGAGGLGGSSAGAGGGGYGGGGEGGSRGNQNIAGGGAGGSFANPAFLIGTASFAPSAGPEGRGGDGGADGNRPSGEGKPGNAGWIQIRFIFVVFPTNSSDAITPRSFTVTFDLPEGVNCSFANVEASPGSWVQLPSAQDCTTNSADTPTLLGWATQADFPVQIAQRQVTNGWGAYETFDENGALSGVFIPAGGFTVLTADTDLYPIWA